MLWRAVRFFEYYGNPDEGKLTVLPAGIVYPLNWREFDGRCGHWGDNETGERFIQASLCSPAQGSEERLSREPSFGTLTVLRSVQHATACFRSRMPSPTGLTGIQLA